MKITDSVEYLEDLSLQDQSIEFHQWYSQNVMMEIVRAKPDFLDEFSRPVSQTFKVGKFTFKRIWCYIEQNKSNWACSEYKLEIKEDQNGE